MEIYSFDNIALACNNVAKQFLQHRQNFGNIILSEKGLLTQLQSIHAFKQKNKLDAIVAEIMINHAISAEIASPGAFFYCIDEIVNNFFVEKLSTKNDANARIATLQDVYDIVKDLQYNQPVWLIDIVLEALMLAGHGGRIIVERAARDISSVEKIVGNTFFIAPGFRVNCKLLNPKILLIDGYVESVAELNKVLQAANESKVPLLIFFRGANNDIFTTLKVNFDRRSLQVVPFVVNFDLEGLNQLRDIATIVAGDVVSSDKGQLISSVNFESLPTIQSATIYSDRVVLSCSKNANAIKILVDELRVRRVKSPEILQKIYDDRIRSLMSNHVVIRLPNDGSYVLHAQFVDYVLRAVKSLVDHGVVLTPKHGCFKLAATQSAALHYAKRCLNVLHQLGAVITQRY